MGIHLYSALLDPDLEITGGEGVGAGERLVSKKNFLALRASVWFKIKGARPPLLDPPLFWYNNHIARGARG